MVISKVLKSRLHHHWDLLDPGTHRLVADNHRYHACSKSQKAPSEYQSCLLSSKTYPSTWQSYTKNQQKILLLKYLNLLLQFSISTYHNIVLKCTNVIFILIAFKTNMILFHSYQILLLFILIYHLPFLFRFSLYCSARVIPLRIPFFSVMFDHSYLIPLPSSIPEHIFLSYSYYIHSCNN